MASSSGRPTPKLLPKRSIEQRDEKRHIFEVDEEVPGWICPTTLANIVN